MTHARPAWLVLFGFFALSISPPTARAAEPASVAGAYAEATRRFVEGQYDPALEAIGRGLAIDSDNLDLLRLRGEVMLVKRDFEGALASYEAFLAARPRGANQRRARRIVADLASVRTTSLRVTISNGPARVYIDSRSLGLFCVAEPDCQKGMLPGRYRLFIEREGFRPLVERIDVALGTQAVIERSLDELPSQLTVDVMPRGARIAVDGTALADSATTATVDPGDHRIEVALRGFETQVHTISAHAGEPVALEVELAKRPPAAAKKPAPTRRPPPTQDDPRARFRRGRAIAAIGIGAAGVGALAAAGLFGLEARSQWDASEQLCDSELVCSPQGFDRVRSAQRAAHIADMSAAFGIGAGVTALVLWLTLDSGQAPTRRPAVDVGSSPDGSGIGVSIGGGF